MVGRPAERLDVGVVEALARRSRRFPRIRLGDLLLQSRIALVLGVVVYALLSDRIGRIADDDADGAFALPLHARRILLEVIRLEGAVLLVEREGVGEADALEGSVEELRRL